MYIHSVTRWLLLYTMLFVGPVLTAVQQAMVARYGPSLNWEELQVPTQSAERYWRTKDEWFNEAVDRKLPLSGLRIALDPGHLGGKWAESEGRNFRMSEDDYWVREGDLVLEVAERIQARLEPLGAEVTLLRGSSKPVNPKQPKDYLAELREESPIPDFMSQEDQAEYGLMLEGKAVRKSVVSGELAARARLINVEIQPDIVLSLHINAVPWKESEEGERLLSDQHHLHLLIFGAVSPREAEADSQSEQLLLKVANGSGDEELELGIALASSLSAATELPPAVYRSDNVVLCDPEYPYVWARNLYILRAVQCPIVMLEPYVANSKVGYKRIQTALVTRANQGLLTDDDILIEYADAVVAGILSRYATECE
ncbi:MAG: N-acetylmuramoyl-L-alanine amidase [Coraliomargarita sp.]